MLSEQDQGKSVSDICRTHGISQSTFYNWKSTYSEMSVNQFKKLQELESELRDGKSKQKLANKKNYIILIIKLV